MSQDQGGRKSYQEELDEHYSAVLSTARGRAVMWDILSKCGVYTSSIRAEPHLMAYQEGRRVIGLELIQKLASIDGGQPYLVMQSEANARRINEGDTHAQIEEDEL